MADIVRNNRETALDVINVVVGLGLALTPWLLGYGAVAFAAWSAWIVGAAIALVALGALVAFAEWEEWVNLLLGVFAIIAPWVLGFSGNRMAMTAHVVAGLIVAVLAAIELRLVRARSPAH